MLTVKGKYRNTSSYEDNLPSIAKYCKQSGQIALNNLSSR